jgi:protein ImuB
MDTPAENRASGNRAPQIACVDIPALPLQLVLRSHPTWQNVPVAMVEEQRPLTEVLWINQTAQRAGISRGMKLSQAQSLCCELTPVVLAEQQVEAANDEIFDVLVAFSPAVEPAADPPGLFWLDPTGIGSLFGTHLNWAKSIHQALRKRGFRATVVVGFSRYLLFAIAQTAEHVLVFSDPTEEGRVASAVRLERLDLPVKLARELTLLGIETLGQLLNLPKGELTMRYGERLGALYELAATEFSPPLQPRQPAQPLCAEQAVEPPDDNQSRLLFALKALLGPLVSQASAQGQAVVALELLLKLDHAPLRSERVALAAPTLDTALMLELLRLRLGAVQLAAPVAELGLKLETVSFHPSQLTFLEKAPRRDLEAAARAIARVKAAFGADSVTRARLCDAYLPEASFRWEPISQVCLPKPIALAPELPLVRRVFSSRRLVPVPDCMRPLAHPDGPVAGSMENVYGPYRVAGGWWKRRVERDYYFLETPEHQILWLYYDRPRDVWILHGIVE